MSAAEMPLYRCHKQVRAKPMTRGEYNCLRGWQLPAGENPDDAGYLVEYIDGGPSNHPAFANYISWSPMEVFEAGYTPAPTSHVDRVRAEKAAVDDNLIRLRLFIAESPVFINLSAAEQARLRRQERLMTEYSEVLYERIHAAD